MNRNNLRTLLLDQSDQFRKKDRGIERKVLSTILPLIKLPMAIVISGLRRSGKSTLLAQIASKYYGNDCYYVNFEDDRLTGLTLKNLDGLYQSLIELFDEKNTFFFDEIQNVSGWEKFVRRLIDTGKKIYITGSNALLLSNELGTKLTGRYLPVELFPFSFREYLRFRNFVSFDPKRLTSLLRANLKRELNSYITLGGIPDNLKYPLSNWPQVIYSDILYRDVAVRFKINDIKILKELSFYLLSNISHPISFNKIREMLSIGNVTTVKNYADYLEQAWLLFTVNTFSWSVKRQQIAAKKIYAIDTGLVNSVAFSFSQNRGAFWENLVFLTLRSAQNEIYYYKTGKGYEVDFYLPKKQTLIQVCSDMSDKKAEEREIRALTEAQKELGVKNAIILNEGNLLEWLLKE